MDSPARNEDRTRSYRQHPRLGGSTNTRMIGRLIYQHFIPLYLIMVYRVQIL